MDPLRAFSKPRIARPIVLFPLPLSPTSASVSPFRTSKVTSSTAFTWPTVREMMPLAPYDWSPRYGWLADRWGLTWQIALGKTAEVGRTVVPSLLFTGAQHGRAEEAMEFWTSLFPGLAIGASVLGFNLLGDALRDAIDPRGAGSAAS